jgi:hypothetical protein
MKAILKFNLPEEEPEHKYALAGTDALLVIEDILNEIRSFLKHGDGEFHNFQAEVWNEETNQFDVKTMDACHHTLERVAEVIWELKKSRNLPELI